MKKINLFFIIAIICSIFTSCSADIQPVKTAPALPNAFTANISVSYAGNEYSGLLSFSESSACIIFSAPDGLNGIKAEYSPDSLCIKYKDTASSPNAQAIPENNALTTIFKKISGAFRTASETQITDTYYIYKNSAGALYVNKKSELPEYMESSDFKITFSEFKTVQ